MSQYLFRVKFPAGLQLPDDSELYERFQELCRDIMEDSEMVHAMGSEAELTQDEIENVLGESMLSHLDPEDKDIEHWLAMKPQR